MVEVPIFFALSAGFVAAFNPCGAPMLPAYMGYQLNLSTSNEKLYSILLRAIRMGLIAVLGFVFVFGITGLLLIGGVKLIGDLMPIAGLLVGITICTIGLWLIFAKRDIGILSANRIDIGPGKGMNKMFLFGIAYAISSLSCALPIFLAAIGIVVGQTLDSNSLLEILIGSLAYAVGMGIVLISLTLITVLFKKLTFAQKSARTLTPYVNICGKLMMVFGGGYITYYWTFGVGGALLSYRIDQLIN